MQPQDYDFMERLRELGNPEQPPHDRNDNLPTMGKRLRQVSS